jgi:hypothetical protein
MVRRLSEPLGLARVATNFRRLLETAEFAPRAAPRLIVGDICSRVIGDEPVEVVTQLSVELALQRVAVSESLPPSHSTSPCA